MHLGLSPTYPVNHEEASSAPACNLGVVWESPWREFGTSVVEFLAGPRPARDSELPPDDIFRVDWVRGRLPGRAFTASSLWHVAAVLLLILPIWGFLPQPQHTLPPVQIEVTYVPAQDLPPISLPARKAKPSVSAKRAAKNKPIDEPGADAYHPRQTIVSIPIQATHPRQTLIQPDAPKSAPKIDAQLPNMVQWATPAPPRPQLQLVPSAAAPEVRRRVPSEIAVPEVANQEKNPGPLNIAAASVVNAQPRMPLSAASAAVAARRQAHSDATAAPDIGTASSGDVNLHRLIALSVTPGPPAPEISVPQENLAARISISPEGKKVGATGSSEHGPATGGSSGGISPTAGTSGPGGITDVSNSLPAAVSISPGNSHAGGIAPAAGAPGKLDLKPRAPDLTSPTRRGPSVVGAIAPGTPPEKILSGKEVYTLNINLPNFTSVAGSWILTFTQFEEPNGPPFHLKGQLSGPVPVEKIDPKYPPQLIKDHVEGQVILYAIIGKDGTVRGIQLVHGVDPELDRDAVDAFARWKFQPGARDGVPVDLEAVVYIPFRYRPPEQ